MKKHLLYITLLILLLVNQSCIKEDFKNCPNWGKYKVGFYDSSNVSSISINHMLLFYSGIDSISAPIVSRSFLMQDSSLIGPSNILKLFPGEYSFGALLSGEEEVLNSKVKLKNGQPYFYATTKNRVIKSPLNKLALYFSLANSMITIKCFTDSTLGNYNVSQLQISPPQEQNALLNINDGSCNYEQCTTDFFENSIYDNREKEWIYYCNPLLPGNELLFKITLVDTHIHTYKTLYTKVFLNRGLEQSKVHRFHLNITPYKVEYRSSTIIDWENYLETKEIQL